MAYSPEDSAETLTNKTLSTPTITSPTITAATITVAASTTPPTGSLGLLWLDTSVTPNTLRWYNGVAWIAADGTTILSAVAASTTIRGLAPTAGTANTAARSDHTHGLSNLTGDVTTNGSGATTLAASGVTAGTYPYANVTVDAKGRVTAVTSAAPSSSVSAVADDAAVVHKAGDTMTGNLRLPSAIISDVIAEKAWTFTFDATTANQKFDLYCSSTNGLESLLDVTATSGFGTLVRRYSLQKQGTGIIQSGSRYTEVIGNISPYLAIGDIEWDTVNLRWRFKIVNRAPFGVSTTGSVSIRLVANTANAPTLISTFGSGTIYTNDTTTYPEPIYQFAGAIQADAIITNFIKKSTNYTLTSVDSILICTAGITVTLPAVASVGVGRPYTVKNIQNAGVTLVPQGTSKIDTALSYTVGNKRTVTVASDGQDWWATSAF